MSMLENKFGELCKALDKLEQRAHDLRPRRPIEENTKIWLVQPFFQSLGYNMDEPSVCEPEFLAGWMPEGGERVDYALFDGHGSPMILVECKKLSEEELNIKDAGQLANYFANTDARVGILTNGAKYDVYLDTMNPPVMDKEPFFKFDLTTSDVDVRRVIFQLTRRTDGSFDMDGFKGHVREWEIKKNYKPEAERIFEGWLSQFDDEILSLLENRVGAPQGSLGKVAQEWFAGFVQGKSLPPTNGDHDTSTNGNGARNEGLIALPHWPISDASDMPAKIIFPDGKSKPLNKGFDVVVETVGWLISKGHLTVDSLPIRTGENYRGKLNLVSDTPRHPDGKPMRLPRETSGVFVDGSYGAPSQVANAQRIIKYAGQDPSSFKGDFS